jgi:predicted nucleic acid-binding protein
MKVVVDTCIWSEIFRKKSAHSARDILATLMRQDRAIMLGIVRQELLSGFRDTSRFLQVRDLLRKYGDLDVLTEDHETAALISNTCRSKGVQGSLADFLLCAVSLRLHAEILTADKDFERFAKHIPIRLFHV